MKSYLANSELAVGANEKPGTVSDLGLAAEVDTATGLYLGVV